MDWNARLTAHELVVGAFIGVLVSAPSADIKNQYSFEIGTSGHNLGQHCSESHPLFGGDATDASVFEGPNYLKPFDPRILRYRGTLVSERVFLKLGGHPQILSGWAKGSDRIFHRRG